MLTEIIIDWPSTLSELIKNFFETSIYSCLCRQRKSSSYKNYFRCPC